MPVVPFSPPTVKPKAGGIASLRAPPPEPFALMAAAQMHAENRLLPQTEDAPSGK